VTKHATVCRIAATVSRRAGLTVELDRPGCHDCRWIDDPATQAHDERSQVSRAKPVMQAFTPSGADTVRQATRESYMAAQTDRHRQERDVVAVVGIGHLDELAAALES
jgi:pheromone shutdown protein TraB